MPWHTWKLDPIRNPVPGLIAVSVLPVHADSLDNSASWIQALESNLLRVEGMQTVRVATPPSKRLLTGPDPKLSVVEGTQGLIELKVRGFDPYYPPSAQVEVNVYFPGQTQQKQDSVLQLERMGVATQTSGRKTLKARLSFQLDIRADDPQVAERLKHYARCQGDGDRGFSPTDRILRISDRFIDFVVYETVKECFYRIDSSERESDGFLRKLINGDLGS